MVEVVRMSIVKEKSGTWSLPRESDTRWQCLAATPGDFDLNTSWVEFGTTGRVLREQDVRVLESDDFDAKEVPPWVQSSGDGNVNL